MKRLAILLNSLWNKPEEKSVSVRQKLDSNPAAGERWILRSDNGDPWGNRYPPVEILDVKDGWVRYKIDDFIFKDERMPIDRFVSVYDYKDGCGSWANAALAAFDLQFNEVRG